ncbi:MAG: hypothetical protein AB1798_09085, partial [Spirochaetota bacterium]
MQTPDEGNSAGRFVIYSPSGGLVAGPTEFLPSETMPWVSVTGLRNGNALMAYRDSYAAGWLRISNPSGGPVAGPILFDGS